MPFIFLLALVSSFSTAGLAAERSYAQLLFARLGGTALLPGSAKLLEVEKLVAAGRVRDAAALAVQEEAFYNVVLKNWASVMLTIDEDPYADLNDAQAMAIGVVRDDADARTLLTGDFIYGADPRFGTGELRVVSVAGYKRLEASGKGLKKYLVRHEPQWLGTSAAKHPDDVAGLLSTRGWAQLYYSAGTNRRAVEGAFQTFLCTPIGGWKEEGLPQYRIRRDIDRVPSGNPATFQKLCSSCHARMDGLAGAFSYVDFSDAAGMSFFDQVVPKYNQNGTVYPEGYVTQDNSWVNFVTPNSQERFGWRGKTSGFGIREFGAMLAGSERFSSCMVERAFKQVCKKEASDSPKAVSELAWEFETGGYRLRDLFINVALRPECLGAP